MKFKKIIIYLISILFLYSCSGVRDALEGKKRSENSDEFLVEKKNPLTEPPDMNELPVPLDQEEEMSETNNEKLLDIEKIINVEQSKNNTNNEENSLEQTILEKINN
jgi:PBP1b-binding outer membrane lipoprotein LpoB|tara:strand:- start:518 stop:838 length:321 start_codon:yes stop_codon:yes gene_type:complete